MGNSLHSQKTKNKSKIISIEKQKDSTEISAIKTEQKLDTINNKDTIVQKKTLLNDKIRYKAKDYVKNNQIKKKITLYNEAELYYQDIELKSGIIVMDYEKNEVYAGRIKDSLGNYTQYPNFKQGSNEVEPDSIRFNTKSKKALIWNSRSDQGEFKIKGAITKKENDSVYFIKDAIFTTSKDIENPEYYFHSRKIKLVPGKKVITGLTNMVIVDVPTPIGLPFAFFPMTDESTSGIIIPTFGDTNQRGYFLQNGGYYFALSKKYDLAVLGDYYTNGSYAMRFESNYAKRYRYQGIVNLRFENQIISERGFPDYSKTTNYNIQWSHMQDPKSNPASRFSASVNMGSSTFFRQSLNQIDVGSTLNNQFNSSVSYSKTFSGIPQVNMSLTATQSQNTNTKSINMTLPTFQASADRIFPFASNDGLKKGLIKNINLQYNVNAQNQIATTDSLFFTSQMFRDVKTGFKHSIPIATNFKVFKHFSVSTGANYDEVWYLQTIRREFNQISNNIETENINGFDAFRTYNFSSSIGTTIYGTFNFGKESRIQAIRHILRPTISYSYTPGFERYFDTYALDASGRTMQQYTRFEGGIYGAPGLNYAQNIGFSLSNTFEAKIREKDSTKTEAKKIMLLNNFNLSTNYNIAADSLAWSPLSMSGGTSFLNDKMNMNFTATLDPYAIDNFGRRIDLFNINNGGSLFRLTSANFTINYSLSSENNKPEKKVNDQGAKNGGREDDLFGTNTDFSDRRKSQFEEKEDEKDHFSGFFNAKLPWDIRFAYSLTYGNMNRQNEIIGNSIMVSTNVDLTPKWKVGVSTGYDFVKNGITFTQLRFEKDLLSWRMDFNWVPYGENTSWGFFIGIKSSMLSDIKWEKRKIPDQIIQ